MTSRTLIGYKPDYDEKEEPETKQYDIREPNGVRNHYKVGIVHGDSIEFIITECFEKLDEVVEAIPGGWTGEQAF